MHALKTGIDDSIFPQKYFIVTWKCPGKNKGDLQLVVESVILWQIC